MRIAGKGTWTALAVVAAVIAVAAASPYWAIYQMKAAAESHDADALSDYVDFPALRESVKSQFMIVMQSHMSQELAGNPFAGLGQMLATTVVNQAVDTMVTPAGVAAMLATGKAEPGDAAAQPSPGTATTPAAGDAPQAGQKRDYTVTYKGWNRVIVTPNEEDPVRFILKRNGFASWKLSAIEMPKDLLAKKK